MDFACFVRFLLEKLSIFIAYPMRTDTASVRFCANSSKMSCLPYSPFCLLREIRKTNILIHFLYLSVKTIWPRITYVFWQDCAKALNLLTCILMFLYADYLRNYGSRLGSIQKSRCLSSPKSQKVKSVKCPLPVLAREHAFLRKNAKNIKRR